MQMLTKIVSGLLGITVLLGGAVYQYPDLILPSLFASEVDYADIFLNENSSITDLTGDLTINGEIAMIGSIVKAGDTLITGNNSRATITYFEDSVTRLEADTTFHIAALASDAVNPLKTNIRGKITVGTAWSKVIRPLDPDSEFAVGSATTVATIRGSAFAVTVDDAGDTTAYSTEHGLSLAVLDPTTQEVVGRLVVPESEQAKVRAESARRIGEIARTIRTEKGISSDRIAELTHLAEQTLEKIETPIEIEQAAWFQENTNADKTHVKIIEEKIERKKHAAIKVQPDSILYALQERADKRQLARAETDEEKAELKINKLKRNIIAQEVVNHSSEEVEMAITELKEATAIFAKDERFRNITSVADLALIEKGYATLLPDAENYALKERVLEARAEVASTEQARAALHERAIRERELDIHDVLKQSEGNENIAPEKLERIQKRYETLQENILADNIINDEAARIPDLDERFEKQIEKQMKENVRTRHEQVDNADHADIEQTRTTINEEEPKTEKAAPAANTIINTPSRELAKQLEELQQEAAVAEEKKRSIRADRKERQQALRKPAFEIEIEQATKPTVDTIVPTNKNAKAEEKMNDVQESPTEKALDEEILPVKEEVEKAYIIKQENLEREKEQKQKEQEEINKLKQTELEREKELQHITQEIHRIEQEQKKTDEHTNKQEERKVDISSDMTNDLEESAAEKLREDAKQDAKNRNEQTTDAKERTEEVAPTADMQKKDTRNNDIDTMQLEGRLLKADPPQNMQTSIDTMRNVRKQNSVRTKKKEIKSNSQANPFTHATDSTKYMEFNHPFEQQPPTAGIPKKYTTPEMDRQPFTHNVAK